MTYPLGQNQIVGCSLRTRDVSAGIPGTVMAFNFVTNGGYSPTPTTGTPTDDPAKRTAVFSLYEPGPNGNPVDILIDGAPQPAKDVPLRIYVTADGAIPYLRYQAVKRGSYVAVLTSRKTGSDDIIDSWSESWY